MSDPILAPSTLFSASAVCSTASAWGPAEPTYHVRLHPHPCLGLPAAPFLAATAYSRTNKPVDLDETTVTITDAHGDSFGEKWFENEFSIGAGEAYVWLHRPSAGISLEVESSASTSLVVDVLPTTGGGRLASLRPLIRRTSRGSVIHLAASAIGLLRLTAPEGADRIRARSWPQDDLGWDNPWITTFGPPSGPKRWYTPVSGLDVLTGNQVGYPVDEPEDAAWRRVLMGSPTETGPGDTYPGSSVDPDAERRRVEALLRRTGGPDLRACLDGLLDAPVHPLDDPPVFDGTMSNVHPRTGATSSDAFHLRLADLLCLAAIDPGVARWLGTMTSIPTAVAPPWEDDFSVRGRESSWRPMFVVGVWRVPASPIDPVLAALLDSRHNLVLTDTGILSPYRQGFLRDDPYTRTRAMALACAVAAPGVADNEPMPSVAVVAGSGRRDRAWVEGPTGGSLRWRQSLQFPEHTPGVADSGVPAGARIAIRRDPGGDDRVVTPVLDGDVDTDLLGRALAWVPRTDTPGGARYLDADVPAGSERTWAVWVVDEFGRWSTEPSVVTAGPPALLDPPPPSLQVRFAPADSDGADQREGRGHLWVRASLAKQHPAGTKDVLSIDVTVGGVVASYRAPDTGWVDRGNDLPVLSLAAEGTVSVHASTLCSPPAAHPGTDQVVDIVDGRLPPPIPDEPEVRWTSRPSPVGTATLRYRNPAVSTGCVIYLTDEPRLHRHLQDLYPPPLDGSRPERAAFYWANRQGLPQELFTVARSGSAGATIDLTVPGRLGDLLLIKVVAQDRNGRPGRWEDAPPFLYAVPDTTIPPPPLVALDHDGAGTLRVTLSPSPGAAAPTRWQLLTCSDPAVHDVQAFLRTTKSGPPPQVFELDCPPWAQVRIAARAALAPEALGGSDRADPPAEWSTTTTPRSFTHVPPDPPPRPSGWASPGALGTPLDPEVTVSLLLELPLRPDRRAVGPHLALVTRHQGHPGALRVQQTQLDPVPFTPDGRAIVIDLGAWSAQGPGGWSILRWWTVAVEDPSGRVGVSTTIYPAIPENPDTEPPPA